MSGSQKRTKGDESAGKVSWWWGLKLKMGSQETRVRVIRELGACGKPDTIRPLIEASLSEDEQVSNAAREALDNLGPSAVDPLTSLLSDTANFFRFKRDRRLRQKAAECLAKMGAPVVTPLLGAFKRLKQTDEQISQEKERFAQLGWHWYSKLVRRNEELLADAMTMICEVLGSIGSPTAKTALVKLLDDTDKTIRKAAASELVTMGASSVDALLQTLGGKHGNDARVIKVLARIGDQRAVEPLLTLLKAVDTRESLRTKCEEALRRFAEPSIEQRIEDAMREREQRIEDALREQSESRLAARHSICVGMSRDEVVKLLGSPDASTTVSQALQDTSPFSFDIPEKLERLIRRQFDVVCWLYRFSDGGEMDLELTRHQVSKVIKRGWSEVQETAETRRESKQSKNECLPAQEFETGEAPVPEETAASLPTVTSGSDKHVLFAVFRCPRCGTVFHVGVDSLLSTRSGIP